MHHPPSSPNGYGDPNDPNARYPLPAASSRGVIPPPPGVRLGATREADNYALIALISGLGSVMGLCCCCIPLVNYLAALLVPALGVVAIIMGWLALRNTALSPDRRTLATVGIAAGATGLVSMIGLMVLVLVLGLGSAAMESGFIGL